MRNPFANNVIPQNRFDAVGAKLASFYPNPVNAALANNFSAAASAPASADEYLIRVDHNISQNTRVFGRWAQKREFKTNEPAYYGANNIAGPGNIRPNNRFSAVAGASHVFTPTFTASGNIGLSRWAEGGIAQGYPFVNTSIGLPASLDAASKTFPIVNVSSQLSLGPTQGSEGTGYRNVGSVSIDFVKTAGRHNLSFGYFGAILQNNGNSIPTTSFTVDNGLTSGFTNATSTDSRSGYGFASLLLGAASGGNTSSNFNAAVTKHYNGFYTEDDWKATENLTFNLGLRYEWQGAPTERHDRQAHFDYNAINPISSQVGLQLPGEVVYANSNQRGIYSTSYTNVAPRFGFSERVTSKLVLRGGYGSAAGTTRDSASRPAIPARRTMASR